MIGIRGGEEINSDLWGPSPVQTPGKKEYYASFTDDHTRWTHVKLLHTKDKVFNAYTDSEAWAKTQFRVRSFKRLRTDHGGKYLSHILINIWMLMVKANPYHARHSHV